MKEDQSKTKKAKISWVGILTVSIVILALWFFNFLVLNDDPNRGTFGDMFGAVNALFSGLAFVGVIYAILLQRKELELQRLELIETREELKGQKVEMRLQNSTLKKQTFESTFFKLLNVQTEITSSITLKRPDTTFEGRACFKIFFNFLKEKWRLTGPNNNKSEIEKINYMYGQFYTANEANLGHYFRSLYYLFKFLDLSPLDDAEKRVYTNLVRAQLSSYELLLIFYNCLSDYGNPHFKNLIEKYSLLKSIPFQLLFKPEEHKELYEESAF